MNMSPGGSGEVRLGSSLRMTGLCPACFVARHAVEAGTGQVWGTAGLAPPPLVHGR